MLRRKHMKKFVKTAGGMLFACLMCGGISAKPKKTTLTMLISRDQPMSGIQAVCDSAEKSLGIKVEMEVTSSGIDLDNMVKTRLASGDVPDLIVYNTGSLLAPLDPQNNFINLSGESFSPRINKAFRDSASIDGQLYAIPFGLSQAGAVMYNKKVYKKYGLSVPKTWKQFIANCDVLRKNGVTAIIGTFKDSWTSQVLFLGDSYNVCKAVPDFPAQFEKGNMKYATTPAALRSWQKLADTTSYYNKDYLASTVSDGCDKLASGEGAHYIMLTDNVLPQIASLYPDKIDDIGVFAIPGDTAEDNGITVWMPSGIYGSKNSRHVEAIKKFLNYYMSDAGLDVYCSALDVISGPMPVNNYTP
ncbi:MAG TPA: hypothetical protein DCL73_00385, partial [Treponema sp.]|nr:hypothetical protein [Treponema sp.]